MTVQDNGFDRRAFVATLAAAAAGALRIVTLGPTEAWAALTPSKGHLLLGLSGEGGSSTVRFYDWDSGRYRDYSAPLENPHSLSLDRKDPRIVYLFEAFGAALRLDLESGQSLRVDQRSEYLFSGHGVQSVAGDRLFCTEIDRKLGPIVTIRSPKDMKRIGILPKECNVTHQVVHLPGSSIIACGNMGDHGAITFYDYDKEKVVRRVEFGVPILHLVAMSSTEALGVSHLNDGKPPSLKANIWAQSSRETTSKFYDGVKFLPGPIVYASTDGTSKKYFLDSEPELFLFSFAVAPIPNSKMFLSSQQVANQVLLWKDGRVVHRFPVGEPSHLFVSKDGKQFMVRCGESALKTFSLESFQELSTISDKRGQVLTLAGY